MTLATIGCASQSELSSFSCGNEELDKYLREFALINDKNGYGKTFLLYDDKELVGFFTLSSASIRYEDFPKKKSMPKYPIPAVRIARLAVRKDKQGKGYGAELLKQAFLRIMVISEKVGVRLIVVDAKETSASFYEHYGFGRLKDDGLTHYLLLETLLKAFSLAIKE